MRVIGGSAKGVKLEAVPGESTRPILDRIKVTLFDMLRPGLSGAKFLDLFAGSGSVGIEALSQGAASCVFIEIESKAVKVIRSNLAAAKLNDLAIIQHTDAFSFLKRCKDRFDIIFVAPPQYRGLWVEALHMIAERSDLVSDCGQVVVQIDPKEYEALQLAELKEVKKRRHGNSVLVFYEKSPQS